MLFIDYGFKHKEYYLPERNTGTLMCHYRHHSHTDPFYLPGLQDITSHVDFTLVQQAAIENQLAIEYFDTQANFLLNNSITELIQQNDDAQQQLSQSNAIQKLIFPHEMGELFKTILLSTT